MFKTYDNSGQAFVDRDPKYYDTNSGAWVIARSGKTYDVNSQSWIERLKKYMSLTVTDPIYDRSGNRVYHVSDMLYLDVYPSSENYYVNASIEGEFVNPIITGVYTFGLSDKYSLGSGSYFSHDCLRWYVNGYLNGVKTATIEIVSGHTYRTTTVFDVEFTKTLSGTFDKIELQCMIISYIGSYQYYGMANTNISNFAIDGTKYYGDNSIVT